MPSSSRLSAILFTDIVGFTAMMESDKTHALAVAKQHEEILIEQVKAHHGEIANFYGDGSLSLFKTATDALTCAREIQLSLKGKVPLRIGIHDGEVVFEGDKVYGNGVNLASRIESSGHAGTILFSKSIYEKIKNDSSFRLRSLGYFNFKNVEDSYELFGLEHEELVPINKSQLQNRIKRKSTVQRAIIPLGILGLLVLAIVFVRPLLAGAEISEEVRESRIAVAIYDNQTQDESMDVLGAYLSENLQLAFDELDVKTVAPANVKEHLFALGVIPGNPEGKPSFLDYTGAQYAIEGSIFLKGKDSITVLTNLTDKSTGENIFSFDPIEGPQEEKEKLSKDLQDHILGYWANREKIDQNKMSPPNYQAFLEFQKSENVKTNEKVKYLNKAIEIDSNYLHAYFALIGWYGLVGYGKSNQVDSLLKLLGKKQDLFTQYERDWYEDLLSSQAGNNEKSLRLALKYFERDPKNYQENYYSGYLSLALNYVDKAIEIWEHINDDLIDYPENAQKYWRLGNLSKAYCIAGQPQRALDLLDNHFPFSSGYWYGHWMKIRALVMLDRVQDVRTMINESSWHSPGFQAEISFFACHEFYIQGNSDMVQEFGQLSIKYYEDDLKKYDDNRNHYRAYQIGVLNYLLENYSEAHVIFKSFIEKLDNSYEDEELDDTLYPDLYTWALASQSKLLEEEAVINNNYIAGIERTGSEEPIGVGSPYESRSYALAVVNTHLGNQDKAMELLNTSFFDKGVFFNYNRYNYDPLLVPLFNNPSFKELVNPRVFKK